MKYTYTIQSTDQSMESGNGLEPTICDTWCTLESVVFVDQRKEIFLYSVQRNSLPYDERRNR